LIPPWDNGREKSDMSAENGSISTSASLVVAESADASRRVAQRSSSRILGLDILRGAAAVGVMLWHYTFRYEQIYGPQAGLSFRFRGGHYGVTLFFIISGFVILMTLEKCKTAKDFVVARFTRLYPPFWVAMILTFSTLAIFGLPGREVSGINALKNLPMVPSLLHAPYVDGDYWTLEIELCFYALMLVIFLAKGLKIAPMVMLGLVALALIDQLAARWHFTATAKFSGEHRFGQCIYAFVVGMSIYQMREKFTVPLMVIAGLALLYPLLAISRRDFIVSAVSAMLVLAASRGWLQFLTYRFTVFFGTISYSLYLIHQDLGFVIILHARDRGVGMDAAIVLAIAVSLAIASAITFLIERPIMRLARSRRSIR
jgi:peptidoglycan/LPS O-acetylase OafA/YrhL